MIKQDLRVTKTLKQIDSAFFNLLKNTPFNKIKVEQICREALINRSTFYTYYQDKFDLLDKYLFKILNEFHKQIDVAFINSSPYNVNDLIYQKHFEKLLKFLYANKDYYTILWNIPLERNIFSEMIDIIHVKIIKNITTKDNKFIYADLYAKLFSSNMMTLVRWWFKYEDKVTILDVQKIMTENMQLGMFQTFKKISIN